MGKLGYNDFIGLQDLSQEVLETAAFGGCHILSNPSLTTELSPKLKQKITQAYQNHRYHLTEDEFHFHTLGFANAIIWLNRNNLLSLTGNSEDDPFEEDELTEEDLEYLRECDARDAEIRHLLNAIIIAVELG